MVRSSVSVTGDKFTAPTTSLFSKTMVYVTSNVPSGFNGPTVAAFETPGESLLGMGVWNGVGSSLPVVSPAAPGLEPVGSEPLSVRSVVVLPSGALPPAVA